MGKQSRNKKKSSSSSHKERQQQRRERVEDHLNSEQQQDYYEDSPRQGGNFVAAASTVGSGAGGTSSSSSLQQLLCPNCGSKDIEYDTTNQKFVCVECGGTAVEGVHRQLQHHRQLLTGDHVISLVNDCDISEEARPEDNHGVILEQAHYTEDGEEIYGFLPIKNMVELMTSHEPGQPRAGNNSPIWKVPTDKIITNWWGWTLRFEVGDKVLCSTSKGWVPAIVTYQWPIHRLPMHRRVYPKHRDDKMVFYECKRLTASSSSSSYDDDNKNPLFVPRDIDGAIMKDPPTFRFTIGTKVVVSMGKTIITQSSNKKRGGYNEDAWIEGTISRVRVLGFPNFAYYECNCTLASGKTLTCHILKDDDEHVANSSSSPRERFLDAIEQNCSLDHLDYLTNTLEGGMDVSTFQSIVLKHAIATASYNGLLWLEKCLDIDLNQVEDEHGNALLHQIAKNPNVMSFLRCTSERSFAEYGIPYIELRYVNSKITTNRPKAMIYRKNAMNQTWLHILAQEGNIKALDYVFNPLNGIFWLYSECNEDDIGTIVDTFHKNSKVQCDFIQQMVAEFLTSCKAKVHLEHMRMRFAFKCSVVTEEEFLKRDSMSGLFSSMHDAEYCIRFCRDWEDHYKDFPTLDKVLYKLASFGYYRTLRQMVEAGATFSFQKYQNSRQDKSEFIQPELERTEGRYINEEFTIISGLVHGEWLPGPSLVDDPKREFDWYLSAVRQCMANNGDLATFLGQVVKKESSSYGKDYYKEVSPLRSSSYNVNVDGGNLS